MYRILGLTNLAINFLVPSVKSLHTPPDHVLNTLDIFLVTSVRKIVYKTTSFYISLNIKLIYS